MAASTSSKAGELGITEAYEVLKRYASLDN